VAPLPHPADFYSQRLRFLQKGGVANPQLIYVRLKARGWELWRNGGVTGLEP
jgi:hypothetical protein